MSLFFRPLLHRISSIASVSSSRYFSDVASKPTSSSASPTAALADPLASPDYFGFRDYLSLEQLFKARVHLGHRSMLRNPYMTPYLFGCRQGIDIIDLDQTLELLFAALNFTAHIAYRGGIILFMTQHKQMMPLVEQTARTVGEYSYCRPWGGGVFTDSSKFFKSTAVRLPDLVIMLNTLTPFGAPHVAVRDAAKMLIPTVAVVDSNCDPRLVTYPIPGNDDSPTAVRLYCSLFAEAVSHGKRRARRDPTLRQQLKERQTVA